MKRERGITLIALVITIIVLLILAGVSISLTLGNNGVLNQATNAVSKNREAAALEDVQMAWAGTTADYWNDWAEDSSKNISDYRTKAKLDLYLNGKGSLEEEPRYNDTDKEYTVKYRAVDQNELYTFLVSEDGNVRKQTGVILDSSELFVVTGNTATLTVKLVEMPGKTNDDIIWSSSDNSKVTVDNGVVTGMAKGTVTVTATCGEKSDTCSVIVADSLLSVANIGDYVDINIGYTDKCTSPAVEYTSTAWRVILKDNPSGTVKLTATGRPLTFYHPLVYLEDGTTLNQSSGQISVDEMKTIENSPITVQTSTTSRGYQKNGFSTDNICSLFSNRSIFDGITIMGYSEYSALNGHNDLRYPGYYYWLAEKQYWNLTIIQSPGNSGHGSSNQTLAVRPVVTLAPGVCVLEGNGSNTTPYKLYGISY